MLRDRLLEKKEEDVGHAVCCILYPVYHCLAGGQWVSPVTVF